MIFLNFFKKKEKKCIEKTIKKIGFFNNNYLLYKKEELDTLKMLIMQESN